MDAYLHAALTRRRLLALGLGSIAVAALPGCLGPARPRVAGPDWGEAARIRAGVAVPAFPGRVFDVTDFGAIADGKTPCREAIQDAVDRCHSAGGGTVRASGGRFLTGAIELKSNVNLRVENGATLLFSTDPADYLPVVHSWWEGMQLMNYSPFIYAMEQDNIAVTGGGLLDGQASFEHWWPWRGPKPWSGTHSGDDTGWREGMPHGIGDREALIRMMEDDVPVAERVFGPGHYLRPCMIQPIRCRNVLIEDVRVRNAPFWAIHPVLCNSITARGVEIYSKAAPNGDGIDPESCDGVVIEGCNFFTGDDCIAIKSGRDADGRRLDTPCRNIVIADCYFQTERAAIVLGSEGTGGIYNVFVENIAFGDIWRAIRMKANSRRGAVYENVHVRNVTLGKVHDTIFEIDSNYKNEKGEFPSAIRNVSIDGLTCEETELAFSFTGSADTTIEDVHLANIEVGVAHNGSRIADVDGLSFDNVRVNGRAMR